jgi:crotonobetainyl-CoA:carnitine CoA-transferase CaiB-like acyl-CoA transferase
MEFNSKLNDDLRSSDAPNPGLLSGVRVLEFGSFLAGPFMARLLADFGADVVKVEPPNGGDQNRTWGIRAGNTSYSWFVQARNKKCITCDLHLPKGQALARRLAAKSDIVLENFRPGKMAEWGLGYDVLRGLNPKVVMVHISGFGQTGPYKDRAGFGSVGEAMGGVRYLTCEPGRQPIRTGVALGDSVAGLYAGFASMMALRRAEQSGQGQEIDVAITEAVLSLMDAIILEYSGTGQIRQPRGGKLGGGVPSNIYPSADGHYIVIGGNSDSIFRRLMKVMGRPELADDARYRTNVERLAHESELDELIGGWTRQNSAEKIMTELNDNGVPAGPIYNSADIVKDPHFREREALVEVYIPEAERNLTMQGIVPKLSSTPGRIRWAGPTLGEHNREIYEGLLGLEQSEMDTLREERVI